MATLLIEMDLMIPARCFIIFYLLPLKENKKSTQYDCYVIHLKSICVIRCNFDIQLYIYEL